MQSKKWVIILVLLLSGIIAWSEPLVPVLYYQAEGSGLDSSINNNPANLYGGATFSAGKYGQAFSFDGVDDYVSAGTVPELNFSESHSISFWVYLNRFGDMRSNAGNKRSILMAKEIGYYGLQIQSTPYSLTDDTKGYFNYSMCYTVNSTGQRYYFDLYDTTTYQTNQWHHISAVYNKAMNRTYFYINGILVMSKDVTGLTMDNPITGNLYIGAHTNNCGYDFTSGQMDEILLFDRAISQQEILSAMAGNIPEPSGLVLFAIFLFSFAWRKNMLRIKIFFLLACFFFPWAIYALPVNEGLLAYYDFNTGIVDVSGNNRSTTLYGDISTSAGTGYNGSNGLLFDGINDYVYVSGVPLAQADGASNTVSFWMKWAGYNKSSGDMPVGFSGHDLWIYSSNFGFNTGQSDITGISNAGLANTWVYVTAVFNNSSPAAGNHKLYINGVLQTITQRQGTTPIYSTAPDYFYMGTWSLGQSWIYKGLLDDVSLYNRELSSSEVVQLYNFYTAIPEASSLFLFFLGFIFVCTKFYTSKN